MHSPPGRQPPIPRRQRPQAGQPPGLRQLAAAPALRTWTMTSRFRTANTLRKALERLSAAALARDATMGDPCTMLAAKAELAAANKAACEALAAPEPEPEPMAARCPDCVGSEQPGWRRGVRCATCDGTATVSAPPAAPAPVVPERWVIVCETVLDVGYGKDVRTGGAPELGYALLSHAATFPSEDAARLAHKSANLPLGWVIMPLSRLLPDLSAAPVVREPRRVRKIGGSFQHTGTVVAEFRTTAGEPRIVLEFDAPVAGMLHVYRPDQVEPCEPAAPAQPAVPLTEGRITGIANELAFGGGHCNVYELARAIERAHGIGVSNG